MPISLDDYDKQEKRKACKVCKLPPQLREQIRNRNLRVLLPRVVAWLRDEGHTITERELMSHLRGGHEPLMTRHARRRK